MQPDSIIVVTNKSTVEIIVFFITYSLLAHLDACRVACLAGAEPGEMARMLALLAAPVPESDMRSFAVNVPDAPVVASAATV